MANRFWVGGGSANTWAATASTNWAATSGGANNQTVPGTTDLAIFDSNSGAGGSVIGANITVQGLDCTGGTGDYAGNITQNTATTLTINTGAASSLRFSSGMTFTHTGTAAITFTNTGTPAQITSAGKRFNRINQNGAGGIKLLDNIRVDLATSGTVSSIQHSGGTFDANGFTLKVGAFICNSTGAVTLGGDVTISAPYTTGTVWSILAGITFTKNSANIIIEAPTALIVGPVSFSGGGKTYNDLTINTTTTFKTTLVLIGSNTFNNLTIGRGWGIQLGNGGINTQTVTALTFDPTASFPVFIISGNTGQASTISQASGTVAAPYAYIRDMTGSGGATFTSANSLDFGNNTGWSITAPSAGGSAGASRSRVQSGF